MAPHIHITNICRILHLLTSLKCGLRARAHTHTDRKLDKRCSTSWYNKQKSNENAPPGATQRALNLDAQKYRMFKCMIPLRTHINSARVCVCVVEPRLEHALSSWYYHFIIALRVMNYRSSASATSAFFFFIRFFSRSCLDVRWRDGSRFYADLSSCVRTAYMCDGKTGRM